MIKPFWLQYIGGFSTFLLPFAPTRVRAALLPYHKAAGLAIFILGGVTAFSGMTYKNAMELVTEPCLGNAYFNSIV